MTGSYLMFYLLATVAVRAAEYVPDARPPSGHRTLQVEAVEQQIKTIGSIIGDENLRQMWENTYPATLDTTLQWHNFDNPICHVDPKRGNCPLAYITSGDIPAMWLRDSANQITQYADLIQTDTTRTIENLFLGLVNMQAYYLREYEFASAYRSQEWTGLSSGENVLAKNDIVFPPYPADVVWEAKFELDSWASFFQLVTTYWDATAGNTTLQNRLFEGHLTDAFLIVLGRLEMMQLETKHPGWSTYYSFTRLDRRPTETQAADGNGNPGRRTGMVRSLFRPTDDATIFPYLIPSNMQLVVGLRGMRRVLDKRNIGDYVLEWVDYLVQEIEASILKYGTVVDDDCVASRSLAADAEVAGGASAAVNKSGVDSGAAAAAASSDSCLRYVYEVDGFGGVMDMDDATMPNLLTAPLFGFGSMDDPIYQRTRARSLDFDSNPWYFRNTTTGIEGIGSPHTGLNRVWPMAVAHQAMTTRDRAEIERCLTSLLDMQAETGLMHEAVHTSNPREYTRQWFGWANSVFAQLVLHLYKDTELRSILEEFVYIPTMTS